MKRNISITDKWIRIILAIALVTLFVTNILTGTAGIIGLVVAAIALATAVFNFCPLYAALGIKTSK